MNSLLSLPPQSILPAVLLLAAATGRLIQRLARLIGGSSAIRADLSPRFGRLAPTLCIAAIAVFVVVLALGWTLVVTTLFRGTPGAPILVLMFGLPPLWLACELLLSALCSEQHLKQPASSLRSRVLIRSRHPSS